MAANVTIGFVKDANYHIDIQGFNVYHKNRLIKVRILFLTSEVKNVKDRMAWHTLTLNMYFLLNIVIDL